MVYGKRLRALRNERGLSQDRLAELITARGHKVSGANISIIERSYDRTKEGDPTRPHRRIVELAAEILGDDIDLALLDAGYSPNDLAASGYSFDLAADVRVKMLEKPQNEEEQRELEEELRLAYELIRARLARKRPITD